MNETVRCRRCLRETTTDELDALMWCPACQAAERRRAARVGRWVALVAATALALWIALGIGASRRFLLLWSLVLVVAYGVGARLVTELVYGAIRARNTPGARAAGIQEETESSP